MQLYEHLRALIKILPGKKKNCICPMVLMACRALIPFTPFCRFWRSRAQHISHQHPYVPIHPRIKLNAVFLWGLLRQVSSPLQSLYYVLTISYCTRLCDLTVAWAVAGWNGPLKLPSHCPFTSSCLFATLPSFLTRCYDTSKTDVHWVSFGYMVWKLIPVRSWYHVRSAIL